MIQRWASGQGLANRGWTPSLKWSNGSGGGKMLFLTGIISCKGDLRLRLPREPKTAR